MKKMVKNIEINEKLAFIGGIITPTFEIKSTTLKWLYYFYVTFSEFVAFGSVISIGSYTIFGTGLAERCTSGFATIACLDCTLVTIYINYRRKDLLKIINEWNNWFDKSIELEQEFDTWSKKLHRYPIILFTFQTLSMMPWGLCPFFPELRPLNKEKLITAVPSYFPFDHSYSPNREIAIIFQTFGALYVVTKILSYEDLFFQLAARYIAEVVHLRHSFKEMFNDIEVNDDGSVIENSQLIDSKLRFWLRKHKKSLQ